MEIVVFKIGHWAMRLSLALIIVFPELANCQTKISVGYTATVDMVPMFAAVEKGMFARRQIEIAPQLVAVNSVLPAALISNTIQLGTTTTTTFLQAVDGGIDLVSVCGLNFTRANEMNFGVVARTGSGIQNAKDLQGKKVGVPGLNAFLHVLFVDWAKKSGADPRRISFVETPFPQMNEMLKSGSVDAVVAAESCQSRIIQSDTGAIIARFVQDEGLPIVVFSGARPWVKKNIAAVSSFRDAIQEAMGWVMANQEEAREIAARNLKLPVGVVNSVQMPSFGVEITAASLRGWIDIMKDQNMLTREIDVARLLGST
jgi:NitT/TauT family transport system substrate-binding protein